MTGLSLALANLKPGTGKTTSAVWLAHVFAQAGNSVLLVDADPSGSALEWSDLAAMDPHLAAPEAAFPFRIVALPSRELHRRVPEIAQADDVVIIDAPQLEDHAGIARSALRYADEILIPCAPSPIEINRTTPVRDEIAEIASVREQPARSAVLLNRCIARAHSTVDAREALRGPRLRRAGHGGAAARGVRAELRHADQADRLRHLAAGGPGSDRPVRSPMLDPVMSTQREQQKARMAAAAGRRAAPDAGPAGRTAIRSKPVRITLDLSPELYRQLTAWADSAAVTLDVPRVSLADAVRAMIRVAADNPDDVIDRLRRDRDR